MRTGAGVVTERTALGDPGSYTHAVRLLERQDELDALHQALQGAATGHGTGIALTGESGAGKSALVDAVLDTGSGLRLLRAHCDPLSTPRPLGPFRDLAADGALPPLRSGEGVLLAEVCEQVYEALRTEPTVLVVEDLHWADAATTEVLGFVARRVEAMPLVLLVSYRDTEIGPRHPARSLLGDFARREGLRTLPLAPLSAAGVADLVEGTGLDAVRVHELTGGNPFFVTEVAKEPELPLPTSVRDAVLARTAEVDGADFEVLQLVATAPDRLDDRVLPALGVDLPTLRRVDRTALLVRTTGGLVFRHELARQSIESTIPPGGGPGLHARLLDALEQLEPRDPAVLTHHAVGARDATRAARYAREAADEAIRAGAHSEAAAFLEIALDHLDGAGAAERAALLLDLAYQQYMTSRLGVAIANTRATFPLWEEAGDRAGLSAAHTAVSMYEYYSARRRQAEAHADQAAEIAAGADTPLLYAQARAARAYLAYMRSDPALAQDYLDQAAAVAAREHDGALALRSRLFSAINALAVGTGDARTRLVAETEEARSTGHDELASTGYSNIAYLDVEQGRLRSAERTLETSLPFAAERDIPICRHWQTAVRSRLNLAQGHWSAALEDAGTVLDSDGMPLATLWPLLITGLVPLRRGEQVDTTYLDAAWALADRIDEPVRRLAVLSAVAEWCWTTGQPDARVCEPPVADLLGSPDDPTAIWAAGNLALWLRRLGRLDQVPDGVRVAAAEPHRLALEGRAAEAAAWWNLAGDPFAEAMALADSPDPEDALRAVRQLDRLGAVGTADRLRGDLRGRGIGTVPQRPRTSTLANPAGLTNRQLDVARLVARGHSNAEIGARLFISPKTVEHHVSAVLTKCGLPSRRAIVVQASELGFD
ncbi:MAG: AAA family ATPase [Nocardioidaceae bacterium]|nr:AAA family ATPase [Nocardioidaceae bacterium]